MGFGSQHQHEPVVPRESSVRRVSVRGRDGDASAVAGEAVQCGIAELELHVALSQARAQVRQGSIYNPAAGMGGLISMYAICEYPEIFGGAACLSTHWTGIYTNLDNPIPGAFIDYLASHLPDPGKHLLYFDHGTETLDSLYGPYQVMADSVIRKGGYDSTNFFSKVYPGTNHSEQAWNNRLQIPIRFLLKNP